MNFYKIFFTTFLLLSIPIKSSAIDQIGTKALSMGGAFVAVADDPSAVLWNPAGLKQFEGNILHTSYKLDKLNTYPKGSVILVNSRKKPLLDGGIAMSRVSSVVKGIRYNRSSYIIALADQYTKSFSIGISGKYVKEDIDGSNTEDAFTLDSGAIISLGKNVKLGATGYNLNDVSLATFRRKLQVGLQINVGDIIKISADGARLFSRGTKVEYNYNLGGEIGLGKNFFLRGGYADEKIFDNTYAAGGIGFVMAKGMVDYAYIHGIEGDKDDRHMLGLSYLF